MAAGGILTLGLGGFSGAGRLLTLGYSAGAAVAVVNGPGRLTVGAAIRRGVQAGGVVPRGVQSGAAVRQGLQAGGGNAGF